MSEEFKFEYFSFGELPSSWRQRLYLSAQREFGTVPIVRQHVWAEPNWTLVALRGESLVGSVHLVERKATFDQRPILLAGIHNLIVEPGERNNGVGARLMKEAITFAFEKRGVEALLLFCADQLVSFYERMGFLKVTCAVWIEQPMGKKRWESNCLVLSRLPPPQIEIDLCGLPF